MFEHTQAPRNPSRVVVLGAKGFIGNAAIRCLQRNQIPVLSLSREQIDFCDETAADRIARLLTPNDAVLIAAAQAPCKNNAMLMTNILMMKNIGDALVKQPVSHVIYISSDA